jgi:UDP-4-amino-4,6-dideoxy-N-acetyl-beta-L-altrosamine transaminase
LIAYGKQSISRDDIEAVIDVLKSEYLTQGPKVPEFEEKLSAYVGAKFSVAVNSATSGLHLACLALGLKKNDILWTSPISFVASANCALYCGAQIDFVDISLQTLNISIDALKLKLFEAEKIGALPKILVLVHFAGRPAEMKEIFDLSRKYGFKIIDDAAHALGAKYNGRFLGACEFSDLTVFSFHPVKIITTAEGGAITTNSEDIASKLKRLRSHGISREKSDFSFESEGDWYYEQIDLGLNYRMTDLQAALGFSQMDRIKEFIDKRNEIAKNYIKFLEDLPLSFQKSDPGKSDDGYVSAYHLFIINLSDADQRKVFFEYMRNKNIGVNVHYIPIYHHPYYRNLGFQIGYCDNAEKYYKSCVTLPLHPSLTESEFTYIKNAMMSYF